MDGVYEELDEARAEIEKLREEYRIKAELATSLKRAHNEQLSKNKEASSKLEKLVQELSQKDYEISTVREMCEELKSSLTEKESIIKNLSSAHDRLRVDCNEKLRKCEEENKALGSALDEANAKNMDQERQISALKQEVEGVKRLLSFSQNKCLERENKTEVSKESSGQREDVFLKLEEESRKIEDQLKWKKEQFGHLEEAHRKLRNEVRMKEKEWEKEKAELLDGMSSLEMKLESQTRISQDLQRRLEMCNQALAHAESKRKLLEVQLLESRTSFDSVCAEYEDAKLNFENLNAQRDQEIAALRSSLGTKEILYKEMEYQFKKLEQEKQELLISLKELQEAQIRVAGTSSSSKLQNKLKSLEQVHKGCSTNLKTKESEWRSQMEKLSEELNCCKSALKSRDTSLNELSRELEACDSLILKLELLNQETSLVLLVLKSEFQEAQLRLADNRSCMDLKNMQMQENVNELLEQLENKKAALNSVQQDLEEERERVVTLSKKVQTLEELQFPLQKELERLKEMLKESKTCQLQSEEQVLQIQSDLEKVHDALDRANGELYEKFCEANQIEFELQIWKSIAEQLEENLKQNHQMRREVEASLLAQTEVELNLKQEKESLSHQLEEKEKRIDDLHQQLVEVNERVENAGAETETSFGNAEEGRPKEKHEAENLHQLVEEKDQRIYDLQQLVASLEQEFESSTTSFSSRLSQMQTEMNGLRQSWEQIKAAEVFKEMEIQEKNLMIVELETDLGSSRTKIQEIKVQLEKKELELRRLEHELEAKISTSDKTIKKLTENSMNLSLENKNLVNSMDSLSERMERLTAEDMQLMESLGKIVQAIDVSRPSQPGFNSDDEDDDPVKENMSIVSSPLMKRVEAIHDSERSPLRAINT
ncbi:hypothetical protein Salat_1352400 [Sesamum alatum]|uniref:Uncharacterized protein n=1 Tax=Sesamum alatum TaxID=300844 RepID=A0AAE2CQ99_9LAMI|nr:hypothetical protein Salat_1352400 [Sesamum alatum]